MNISVIGTGNVGSGLAARLRGIGHEVVTANSTTPVLEVVDGIAAADLVVLAVPFKAVDGLDRRVRDALASKIVVDATNPLADDFMSLTVGYATSGGERVAAALPGARVVKAFNTVFAANLAVVRAEFLPVASDDEEAKQVVLELGEELGFDAVDAGPLANARYTEPAVELLIQLAFGKGQGAGIGFGLVRA